MQVRINKLPPTGEFDEFDLRRFRAGEVYEVTPQFGMLLIVAGFAEAAPQFPRAEAADSSRTPRPRKRRKRR